MSSRSPAPVAALGLLLLAAALPAAALTLRVGTDPACHFPTVQQALDEARNRPGADEVLVTIGSYTAQALEVEGHEVTIAGGYADCTATAVSGRTVLDGSGGERASVLRIAPQSKVWLQDLVIRGGDAVDGGGIFLSNAMLTVRDTEIANNVADAKGGGIHALVGDLRLGRNVHITGNRAGVRGGGLSLLLSKLEADEWNFYVALNDAGTGVGGGMAADGSAVDIGAKNAPSLPAFHFNRAAYGAGMAITAAGGSSARVRFYAPMHHEVARISGNIATHQGGAVYLKPILQPNGDVRRATFCASNVRLDDNVAIDGAAVYAESIANNGRVQGSMVLFNDGGDCNGIVASPEEDYRCDPDGFGCNTIDSNYVSDSSGGVITMRNGSELRASRLAFRNNESGHLLRAFGGTSHGNALDASVRLESCLVADNLVAQELFRMVGAPVQFTLEQCTVARNVIGGAAAVRFDGGTDTGFALRRSIVDQPTMPVLLGTPAQGDYTDLFLHHGATLPGVTRVQSGDPRFVDPEGGDFHLQPASRAVDAALGFEGIDLDGMRRPSDLPVVADRNGHFDLGAYERWRVENLVRNYSFSATPSHPDQPFRLWTAVNPSYVHLEQDTFSSPNLLSGALLVRYRPGIDPQPRPSGVASRGTAQAYAGLSTCVLLPGSAQYRLDGLSRSPGMVGARDYPRLRWVFRSNDSSCTGPATREGILALPASAYWASASTVIPVAPGEWTPNSTIEIVTEVLDGDSNGTNAVIAYFDDIYLTVGDLEVPDVFKDDFEF